MTRTDLTVAGRWSVERAVAWGKKQPWFCGANFNPSTAINQLEFWQAETFDPETIERELGFADRIGMNLMRVYLHDLVWHADKSGFAERIDRYLAIADGHGMRTMFVLFDDCWRQNPKLGVQREAIPFTHNSGWVQSPGVRIVNDPSQWGRLETYVNELLTRFADDERIALWDLYNEPGNGTAGDASTSSGLQGERSLPLLQAVFGWARAASPSQPLTVGVWNQDRAFDSLNATTLANSDVVTFHCYEPPARLGRRAREMKEYGRPTLCTEYMARGRGSNFEHCLPLLHRLDVGAICWGLVAGKSQTLYPWGWNASKGEPDVYFHDVFWPDGTFLYPDEERVIRRVTER